MLNLFLMPILSMLMIIYMRCTNIYNDNTIELLSGFNSTGNDLPRWWGPFLGGSESTKECNFGGGPDLHGSRVHKLNFYVNPFQVESWVYWVP